MTVSTVKSVNVTSLTANPISVLVNQGGLKAVIIDEIELATTSIDEIGDIILMAPIPSNAIITSIKLFNDDLDSDATPLLAADVGLYYSGKNNIVSGAAKAYGVVVDADCIGSAITTLQAANVSGTEVRFEAADIDTINLEAWELGGLTADCGGTLLIGLTITAVAATAAAGGVKLIVDYISQ